MVPGIWNQIHVMKEEVSKLRRHSKVSLIEWGGKTNTAEIPLNLITIVRFTAVQTLLSLQKKFDTLLTQEIDCHRNIIIDEKMQHMAHLI